MAAKPPTVEQHIGVQATTEDTDLPPLKRNKKLLPHQATERVLRVKLAVYGCRIVLLQEFPAPGPYPPAPHKQPLPQSYLNARRHWARRAVPNFVVQHITDREGKEELTVGHPITNSLAFTCVLLIMQVKSFKGYRLPTRNWSG